MSVSLCGRCAEIMPLILPRPDSDDQATSVCVGCGHFVDALVDTVVRPPYPTICLCSGCGDRFDVPAVAGVCPSCRERAAIENAQEDDWGELVLYLMRLNIDVAVPLLPMTSLGRDVDPGRPQWRDAVLQMLYAFPKAMPDALTRAPPAFGQSEWPEDFPVAVDPFVLEERPPDAASDEWSDDLPIRVAGRPHDAEDVVEVPWSSRLPGRVPVVIRYRGWIRDRFGHYEVRWDPLRGEEKTRLDNFDPSRIDDIRAVLASFQERRPRGAPPGYGALANMTPDEYRAAYAQLWREHRERRHRPPTEFDMAATLSVARTTSYRYRKDHGDIPWPPIPPSELLKHS